jgi:hypothetical protein
VSVAEAAWIHAGLTAFVAAFQLALAAGAPWGRAAMGGRYLGRLPPAMRVASVVQPVILAGLSGLVLARAGVALPAWRETADPGVWAAVGVSAIAAVLNLITPSRIERAIWGPVALGLLATSVWVALKAA